MCESWLLSPASGPLRFLLGPALAAPHSPAAGHRPFPMVFLLNLGFNKQVGKYAENRFGISNEFIDGVL